MLFMIFFSLSLFPPVSEHNTPCTVPDTHHCNLGRWFLVKFQSIINQWACAVSI
jgi:hypothetical protein